MEENLDFSNGQIDQVSEESVSQDTTEVNGNLFNLPIDGGSEPVIDNDSVQNEEDSSDSQITSEPDLSGFSLEQLKALAEDKNTSPFLRKPIQAAIQYAEKIESEKSKLSEELSGFREKFGDYSQLSKEDLERLATIEEQVYNLASYSSDPQTFVKTLSEFVPSNRLDEIKSYLAWEFLETPDNRPNVENLQVIVDRFAGESGKVSAKDVLAAIESLRDGRITSEDLMGFSTVDEYEEYLKRKSYEDEIKKRESFIEENARYQESVTRSMVLQNVINSVHSSFQPQVHNVLSKFNLVPTPNEPEVSLNMKREIQEKLAEEVNRFVKEERHLADVMRALELLSQPNGTPVSQIQSEIDSYINSFAYKTALNKGMSALISHIEKVAAKEAYKYKLLMDGYKYQVERKNNAPNSGTLNLQTGKYDNIVNGSSSEMSSKERLHTKLMNISNMLRGQNADVPKYGS